MKKFLSFLLAALLLLSCIPAMAEEFPKLDNGAAWDYIGDWFGVSGMDVMGDPTTDYPELKLCLYLNGLGDLYLDGGKKEVVGWYVEEGNVFLARTVDGVPKADEIFAYAYKDDTGRLVVDLMTVSVRCEQEGEEYTDVVWPEFNAEDAKYFIGTWEAVTYISEGEEIPAELIGPMTFVLNDDGTAQSIEGEEEPYELRWYSDYSVAYLGETPTELVEISFDGNGNISVKMDAETTIIMAPVAEVVETGTILGTWESSDRTVEITEDGKLKLIYKEDGYTNHMEWEIVDGIPTVTLGTWKDSTIEFVDGYLIINYSVQQKLTRVGAVPEIYVGPGGFSVPAGDSSDSFLGDWVEESGRGVLTFNRDFTAVMNFTDGRVYDMNWKTTEDGAMFTSGNWFDTPMVIEDENTLNIGGGWMILYREGEEEPTENTTEPEEAPVEPDAAEGETTPRPEEGGDPYIGKKFVLVGASINGINLSAEQLNAAGDYVIFNADGSVELFMSDRMVETLGWTRGTVTVVGAEHDGFCVDYYGTYYNFGITGDGLMLDYFGTPRFYEPEVKEEAAVPAAPDAAAPTLPEAAGLDTCMNKKYVAKTYTAAGYTADASMLGAEYALTLKPAGTCELISAGFPVLLNWASEEDRLVIDYMGAATYYVTPTADGLDLDMNGMVLNMVAE
ncbi:MAG: hypothetical protein IKC28_04865 [Clostridia bacterium]|nr:hypothetical protein [Clostridia bacterium]